MILNVVVKIKHQTKAQNLPSTIIYVKKKIRVLFDRIRYYFIYTSRNEISPKFATFLFHMDKCQHR
jgi:hypothetical protein